VRPIVRLLSLKIAAIELGATESELQAP
jgi:hypothetical protein